MQTSSKRLSSQEIFWGLRDISEKSGEQSTDLVTSFTLA
jgi:hypothetical protein